MNTNKLRFWQAAGCALLLALAIHSLDHLAPSVQSQQGGGVFTSLNAATTGTGSMQAVNQAAQLGYSVIWSTGVTAGEVVIEVADTSAYAGTWAEIDRLNFTAAPGANSMQSGTFPGPFRFARARVTTNVTGGTVTVTLQQLTR